MSRTLRQGPIKDQSYYHTPLGPPVRRVAGPLIIPLYACPRVRTFWGQLLGHACLRPDDFGPNLGAGLAMCPDVVGADRWGLIAVRTFVTRE